jgi:hypothetical protein
MLAGGAFSMGFVSCFHSLLSLSMIVVVRTFRKKLGTGQNFKDSGQLRIVLLMTSSVPVG